jgi:hypothetical protein
MDIGEILAHLKGIFEYILYVIVLGAIGKKLVADYLIKLGQKYLAPRPRSKAIVSHYKQQSLGKGHTADSVMDCGEGDCRVFHSPAVQTA